MIPTEQSSRLARWKESTRHWLARLGLRLAPAEANAQTGFPDYVTCPHCGEPEVEVWCDQPTAHCHNCGQEFDHKVAEELFYSGHAELTRLAVVGFGNLD